MIDLSDSFCFIACNEFCKSKQTKTTSNSYRKNHYFAVVVVSNMIPVSMGDRKELLYIFKTIRGMDEFKYWVIRTAAVDEYTEFIDEKSPFIIVPTRHGYSNCIKIQNDNGNAIIAVNTVNELLTNRESHPWIQNYVLLSDDIELNSKDHLLFRFNFIR